MCAQQLARHVVCTAGTSVSAGQREPPTKACFFPTYKHSPTHNTTRDTHLLLYTCTVAYSVRLSSAINMAHLTVQLEITTTAN